MTNLGFISFSASLNNDGIRELASGTAHSCALFTSGALFCWGRNDVGNLGGPNGAYTHIGDAPTEMFTTAPVGFSPAVAAAKIIQVSVGEFLSCSMEKIVKRKKKNNNNLFSMP